MVGDGGRWRAGALLRVVRSGLGPRLGWIVSDGYLGTHDWYAGTATLVRMTSSPQPSRSAASESAAARAAVGGWLEGPGTGAGGGENAGEYRGQRLGLPESGAGSLAPQGRRLGALVVDWGIAIVLAAAFGWRAGSAQGQWGTFAIFGAEQLALLSVFGFTVGKRLFGLRVGKLGGALTPLHVIVRTVLLLLVVPAVVWDRDGRGLHDRAAGTVEVRR